MTPWQIVLSPSPAKIKAGLNLDKFFGIGVFRVLDNLISRIHLHKMSFMDHGNLVTQIVCSGQIMGDKQKNHIKSFPDIG